MNLHIAPDNSFTNKFVENIFDAGLSGNNKIVVRSNDSNLKAIKSDVVSAPLYSSAFHSHVGNTLAYNKVFIHYFTPLLYRWVATNKFKELNWMVWGGDLYNLSALDHTSYEPLTLAKFVKKNRSIQNRLYDLKVWATQSRFRKRAYSKVKNVLTWMREEYNFALANLPIQADHKFFFYENEMPYHELDSFISQPPQSHTLTLIVGNSGSPTNNHLDAVEFLQKYQIRADLLIPVSYGDPHYISFLKRNLAFSYGEIRFIDHYMPFREYVGWLASSDGLVMNSLRPQGYGNIFMMMYLGKPVYLNKNNISLPDLQKAGLKWKVLDELKSASPSTFLENKEAVKKFLSHERLIQEYRKLFS
jgi:dTDP-N-acetylfucosamine:lipid II N-acetylfucosaminyltransferase